MNSKQIEILRYLNDRDVATRRNITCYMAHLSIFDYDGKEATKVVKDMIANDILIPVFNKDKIKAYTINKGK